MVKKVVKHNLSLIKVLVCVALIMIIVMRDNVDCNYSHVAMILKDPYFINPALKGLYVWESSFNGTPDPQDNKIKLGVQITPLHELINEYQSRCWILFN